MQEAASSEEENDTKVENASEEAESGNEKDKDISFVKEDIKRLREIQVPVVFAQLLKAFSCRLCIPFLQIIRLKGFA